MSWIGLHKFADVIFGIEIQKFEYLENEKSFLDEINIFHILRRATIWWNKNLIKNSGKSFNNRLEKLKSIKMWFIAVSVLTFWPSTFLSRGCDDKLSDACDADLRIKVFDFHFLYIYICYVCEDSQITACMKHVHTF